MAIIEKYSFINHIFPMKKRSLLFLFLVLACVNLSAWNRLGHYAIAQIANDHLTSRAKKALLKQMNGAPIMAYGSDADAYRPYWITDIGFIPEDIDDIRPENVTYLAGFDYSLPYNFTPYPHCITIKKNGESYRDIRDGDRYIHNAAWYVADFAKKLKDGSLNDEQGKIAVCLIIHFIGDMHNPNHIYYDSDDIKIGRYPIEYKGKRMKFHAFWDSEILNIYPNSGKDLAALVDQCSQKEIREITKGDVFDWAADSGKSCRPIIEEYMPSVEADKNGGALNITPVSLPQNYPRENRELLFNQLRKAGYRLAKILNEIYK